MGEAADEVRYNDRPDPNSYDQGAPVDETDDTAEIRSHIEQTRADMSETIEAIQERLNPQNIKEQAREQVREQYEEIKATVRDATIGKAEAMVRNAGDTVNEARHTMMDTIRENPIPAALVGIGLGWLIMNGRSTSSRRSSRRDSRYYGDRYRGQYYGGQTYVSQDYGDQYRGQYYENRPSYATAGYTTGARVYDEPGMLERGQQATSGAMQRAQEKASDVASRVQESVGDLADRGQETVGNIMSQAQDTASNIANQAQYQAQRVEDRFQQTLHENPLAVGAIALAVGAAVGLALPQTERENQLMGEARDNLLEQAQSMAQDTVEKVQQVASEVTDQAKTTAREEANKQGLTSQ
jgi:ElaB/YqjD/DUF883 family membrane-anchored ribosome-binding protein